MIIRAIEKQDIKNCVYVIIRSFTTVAEQFGITKSNSPRYVAFSISTNKLLKEFESGKPMFACFDGDNTIVGYYSLALTNDRECELNNLCILPEYRHLGIGGQLLLHAISQAQQLNLRTIKLSIIEENVRLKHWYESFGFIETSTYKFDFFPFTCGYMEKYI